MRTYRKLQGLSIRKLSKMICVDRTILNNIELGKGNPRLLTLEKIAAGLDISIHDLLSENSIVDSYIQNNQSNER